jgi:hypothetical protein
MKEAKKSTDPIIFYWAVPQGGFQWVDAHEMRVPQEGQSALALADRWLILRRPAHKREARAYRPLEDQAALFRTFAETPPTEEGILQFADRYGWLGLRKLVLPKEEIVLGPNDKALATKSLGEKFSEAWLGPSKGVTGESLEAWEEGIWRMRFVLDLWDAIQRNDTACLRQFIGLQEGPNGSRAATYRSSKEIGDYFAMGIIYDPTNGASAGEKHLRADGGITRLALWVVQKQMNEQLGTHTGPSLLYEPRKDRLNLKIVPKNLMGAMWLQFARGIDGNKDYRQCLECGRWFEISLEANRPTRFFCKDACRSKFYRRRVSDAQNLYLEGLSIEEIARRLETDTATVQGWIARPIPRKQRSGR